ncbi:hypothetical protein FXO38_02046 [Capsicum annuum]|nr:hypothetical protein FXO38_02046 [Capsicum annuum]KAF3683011.1 hypothetical protein FXO37_02080 [Capsicum annuum]
MTNVLKSEKHKRALSHSLKDLSSPNWAAFYMSSPSLYKLDSFGKMQDKGKQVASTNKFLTKLFPNKVVIHMPQPCKGILLFGPPGTGKAMLAKDVATEAVANFINISMSSISSKVDNMLGRRENPEEHQAMRRLKNELLLNWDGLRTKDTERVLVLAATNRPFDLDEAVIWRLPRWLMVNLPDAPNRAKILKVILAKEDLA